MVKQNTAAGTPSDLKLRQQAFFERIKEYGDEHAAHVKTWSRALPQHWYDVRLGSSKAQISITLNSQKGYVGVELYCNTKDPYFALVAKRAEIDTAIGLGLDWQELPDKKASRIITKMDGDFNDEDEQDQLLEWIVKTVDRFAQIFPKYL